MFDLQFYASLGLRQDEKTGLAGAKTFAKRRARLAKFDAK